MLEAAQRQLSEIRQLALAPSPGNFETINSKLESLAGWLSRVLAEQDPVLLSDPELRRLILLLPRETARIRLLMQAPAAFYQGLDSLRAQHFGAYERSGFIRSLESPSSTRTLIRL